MRTAVVALACGALAAVTALAGCASDQQDGGPEPSTTASTGEVGLTPDAIPVLRAARPIPAGTEASAAFDQGLIETTTVARADFPVDGVVTLELVEGRRALADIPAGTLLTVSQFSPP